MGLHTLPPQSIPAQASATLVVACRPSAVGDSVIVTPRNPDASFAAVVWHAYVSAPDTVTVKLTNVGAAVASTVAQQFDVRVVPNH